MTDLPPTGVYGKGMDQFIRDETELGTRVAACLDEAGYDPLGFVMDHHYAEYARTHPEKDAGPDPMQEWAEEVNAAKEADREAQYVAAAKTAVEPRQVSPEGETSEGWDPPEKEPGE